MVDPTKIQDAVAAKTLGEAALERSNPGFAASSFSQCINLLNQAPDNQIIALLQNLSIAQLQLQNHAEAFMYAVAVLALFPHSVHPKACCHAARAAAGMGLAAAATWLMEHIPARSSAPPVAKLAATLDASIGSRSKTQVLYSAQLAYAILHASIQLPDPPPHSSFIHSAAAITEPQPECQDESCSTSPASRPSTSAVAAKPQAADATQLDIATALTRQVEAAAQLKAEGADMFKAGDAGGAVAKWSAALAELELLSVVVPRLAEAEVHGECRQRESRCALACVALLWAPRAVGLHVARANQAGRIWQQADSSEPPLVPALCIEQALRLLPQDPELLRLRKVHYEPLQQYFLQMGAAMAASGKTQAQRLRDSEMDGSLDQSSGMMMKVMLQSMMATQPAMMAALVKQAGPMPEDFDEAFFKTQPLPRGCNAEQSRSHLANGAKDAYLNWTMLAAAALGSRGPGGSATRRPGQAAAKAVDGEDPLGGTDNEAFSPGLLAKRFQDTAPERFTHWWQTAPMGSIMWRLPAPYHEVCEKLQTFCNVHQHALPLRQTSTGAHVHVGVGFVDLGGVAETLVGAQRRGEKLLLEWIGFDASAYACARTLIVAQMLKSDAPVDSIIQAWYSAAWSKATLQHFRHAVAALLSPSTAREQPPQPDVCMSREVCAWLREWGTAEVPLERARREWLSRQLKSTFGIANACGREDRHALCAYRLTGQLLDGDTGSVTMFSRPELPGKHCEYTDEEMVLDTVAPQTLVDAYRGLKKGERTLMAAGVAVVRRRVQALQAAVAAGELRVQAHHAVVSATDAGTVARIAARKPDSMSWSNVAEYMQPQSFHHLARRCSLPHTRHFLHAMNWINSVKGTFILDHMEMPKSSAATVKQRCGIMRKAYSEIEAFLKKVGGAGVFRHPVLDNRMNVTDAMLARQMHSKWLEAFVRKSQIGTRTRFTVLHEPVYWYFSRADTAVHFELQYS